MKWAQRIIFGMLIGLVFTVGSLMVYDLTATKYLTVTVDIEQGADPFQTLPRIVKDSGGRVISVKQTNDSRYEIKVVTRRDRQTFLEWLCRDRDVKRAELEEEN